jgi:hypothetical protein
MPMRAWIFLACGANLPPPAPHKKIKARMAF